MAMILLRRKDMKKSKPLTRQQQKELVKIAHTQIEQFIKDWQKSPYIWEKEADVQIEIASRIKHALKKCKMDIYWAKYRKYVMKGHERGQIYSRVCCEPKVFYQETRNKTEVCRPDIVIWDSLKDAASPDETLDKKRINYPLLWVCEIKYRPPWKKDDTARKKAWDLDKMKYLLQQEGGTKHACWLHINFKRAASGNGIGRKKLVHGRLIRYDIRLPAA
jgi:hypothetical protein